MFFILSKTISYLFMPLTIIVGAFVISFFLKNPTYKKRSRYFALVLLIICTNSFLTNNVMKWWEIAPTPLQQYQANHTVGIVLTGVTNKKKLPRDRVYFRQGADRVTHAIQLYKMGKINKIIVSGGSANLINTEIKEATLLAEVLQLCGVNSEDLIIEDQSRNTRESALAVSKMLAQRFPDHQYTLITSGFHMRRSQACFEKVGVRVQPFSTDFRTSDDPPSLGSIILPSPTALVKWHVLVREWMGVAAYKVAGYI